MTTFSFSKRSGPNVRGTSGTYTCPKCGKKSTAVKDSRASGEFVRRRRVCMECTYTFSTIEVPMETFLGVDLSREANKAAMALTEARARFDVLNRAIKARAAFQDDL